MKNNIQFLSYVLSNNTIGYGGKKEFIEKRVQSISSGDSCNQSHWSLNNHIGTHLDAPVHFSETGKSVDQYHAHFWIFESVHFCLLPAKESEIILPGAWCESIKDDAELLIIKTGFGARRDQAAYWAHNPGLSPELGVWLRTNRKNTRAIGFDFISLTSYDHRALGKEAHRAFLHEEGVGKPIVIIEDMDLTSLSQAPKRVTIAPIRVEQSDGAPVTVIAEL